MRLAALLLVSCVAFAQSPNPGKPGVTDPIKDPQQVPGNPNPGPIPRTTPQPSADAEARTDRSENKKSKKKTAKKKPNPPAR